MPDLSPNGIGQGPVVPGGGQGEGLPVMHDRLLDLSPAGQCQSEAVVGDRVVGRDFQGLPVMDDRLLEPAAAGQSVRQVVVGLRVAGIDFQDLPVLLDRLVKLSAAG